MPELGEVVAAAAAAWPEIRIDPEVFGIYVTTRLPADVPVALALATLHAEDLYLAAACALGDPRAAAELDRVHLRGLCGTLAATGLDHATVDDLLQALREYLLVAGGGAPPAIADYAGRGRLSAWLRIIAMRRVFRHRRGQRPPADGVDPDLPRGIDPFAATLRDDLRQPVRNAVRAGIDALPERDRRLLQLSVIEGVQARTLARSFGVHESTISRWLVRAHDSLRRLARGHLQHALVLPPWELDSILRACEGHFSVTTGSLFLGEESRRTKGSRTKTASGGSVAPPVDR